MNSVQRLLLLILSLFLAIGPVFAQKITSASVPQKRIEYTLPYPGILPDHPLFTIKNFRDKIIDFLTVDALRKSEFYLLLADKRLGMGKLLLEQGKTKLALQSIEIGETFMSRSVEVLVSARSKGREIPDYLLERLTNAAYKHEEVLTEFINSVTGSELTSIQSSLEMLQKTIENIAKLN